MTSKTKDQPRDEAVEKELDGVPKEFLADADSADTGDNADSVGDNLDAALDTLRNDLDAAKQDALYARAEIQNVRRRLEKDVQDARNYAATGFARDILSVADNLARALGSVSDETREDEKVKGFVAGIEATQRELEKVFNQHGIARIAAKGLPLDPNLHQAMMQVEADAGHEPGTVVEELQPGYTIKGRLLRPAMVSVAQ